MVAYGEDFACECGRTYSTNQIPESDYAAVLTLDRKYRRAGQIVGSSFAFLFIFVILTRPFMMMALVPMCLLAWMVYGRPFVRRRYWREVGELTCKWKLRPTSTSPKASPTP